MKLCSILNCNEKHRALGYCDKHYMRVRKNGDPNFTLRPRGRMCSISGCNNKHDAKGLCHNHYTIIWSKNHRESINITQIKYGQNLLKNVESYKDFKTVTRLRKALYCWGKEVKKRDGYICVWCGSTIELEAHHELPKSLYPELALDINNGVTVCKDCHDTIPKVTRFS